MLDLLAAQQERAPGTLHASSDPGLRARNRAEIEAVIGRERAEQLEMWQHQLGARLEMRHVREQLEDVGEPLSEEQLARIGKLIDARLPAPVPEREGGESDTSFRERFMSWRNENRERLREDVTSVLEPRQLARYYELDALSRSIEEAMPDRARSAAGAGPPLSR